MFFGVGITSPVEPVELSVGDRLRFDDHTSPWWTVQAVSENFVACVRTVSKGDLAYTVIDWRNGVRGTCNLIGWGWGDGTYSTAQCEEMLSEFESDKLEISHRNWVLLIISEIQQ